MRATLPYIKQKFDNFNQQIFAGKLPPVPIRLSHAKTFLGKCTFKKRIRHTGEIECYDFRLHINAAIDMPESLLEDTLIHEMIHYFIGFKQWKDRSAHGPIFRNIMHEINTHHNRNLSISYKQVTLQDR